MMSSSEEKSTSPVYQKDSDHSSSSSLNLQDEYEELLRYAVVTPKFEPSVFRHSECIEARQTPGNSPRMDERRQEIVGIGSCRRKCGRTPDFTTRTTRIEVSTSVKGAADTDLDGLYPINSEESSSEESSSSQRGLQETNVAELSITDDRVTQIESILDLWSGSLKTNVLTELRKLKLLFLEHHALEMRQEKEKHAAHVRQLTNQLENLKELLHTYEVSMTRKDEVIANLTDALKKEKDRVELMRKFMKWRLQHLMGRQECKQEVYAERLADRLYEMGLLKKAWSIWYSASHKKWKDTMEKACQSSAESVRVELSSSYECKISELNVALEQAKSEVAVLQNKRQDYEDTMKKAFMRGVCALNLEAMTIFQGKEVKLDYAYDLPDKRTEPGAGTGSPTSKLPTPPSHTDPPSQWDHSIPPPPAALPTAPPAALPTAPPAALPTVPPAAFPTAPPVPPAAFPTAPPVPPAAFPTAPPASSTAPPAAPLPPPTAPDCGPDAAPVFVPVDNLISSHQSHAVTSQTRLDSVPVLICSGAAIQKWPMGRIVTSAQQKPGRTITARITGRCDHGSKNRICSNLAVLGVNPPMSSVVVEKHLPITQQTISQAIAAKYPRAVHQFSSGSLTGRSSGHSGKPPTQPISSQCHGNIQSIKVVD